MNKVKDSYPINFSSRVFKINPRSYYRHFSKSRQLKQQAKQKEDVLILEKIEEVLLEVDGYGYRKMSQHLKKQTKLRINGQPVNHKRIYRLMKDNCLLCQIEKNWINTTDSDLGFKKYPNLIKDQEQFKLTGLDQLWVSDITYIRLQDQFIYLAVILDAFSRRVIGYHLSQSLDRSIVLKALNMALRLRGLNQNTKNKFNLIHHSDQGIQYCSKDYTQKLKSLDIRISMSDKGAPWQNAKAEAFFKHLKREEVYLSDYQNYQQAKENITKFIADIYNKKRIHGSIDYETPTKYEKLIKREENIKMKSNINKGDLVVTA